jgi:hypothetical protein
MLGHLYDSCRELQETLRTIIGILQETVGLIEEMLDKTWERF